MKSKQLLCTSLLVLALLRPFCLAFVPDTLRVQAPMDAVQALYTRLPAVGSTSEIMIYVQGSSTPETTNTIAAHLPLLTGVRYQADLSLRSDYEPGQVLVTLRRKEPALDEATLIHANKIAQDARKHSGDRTEQLRYVNAILCRTVYDYASTANLPESDGLAWSAYGCLIKQAAVCEGYANAFMLICEALDIPVCKAAGTAPKGGAHIWNQVYVDGRWRAVDVTVNASSFQRGGTGEKAFLISGRTLARRGYTQTADWQRAALIKYPELGA